MTSTKREKVKRKRAGDVDPVWTAFFFRPLVGLEFASYLDFEEAVVVRFEQTESILPLHVLIYPLIGTALREGWISRDLFQATPSGQVYRIISPDHAQEGFIDV